ncbi:acyclic terpene utilization AtuA family protein [Nocardioides sp. LHD-245]|uniref:acyclic terpene utilization AtuA family protein n=1 Tax=Nocardioides sp. LHD-245 TaxID=3051387 RepID=UPI0027DEE1D2|nr:acyclic terpene utilization AtuA family protein [Nocardioides sp. LHD-245]
MTTSRQVLRIGNCSGFYGDRLSAAREMVEGGPIDVLTGDYLAELTMLILWKSRQRNPDAGYATTFLTQVEEVLGTCLDRGIRIVSNAGGLNPGGLAREIELLAARLGLQPRIAHVEGDDLLDRLPSLQAAGHPLAHLGTGRTLHEAGVAPVTANAYLGGWGIAEALRGGADIVVCPRVTDASLVVGPAAWAFDWRLDDWDALAGAVVAGHVIECGPQATGGNYSFFTELPGGSRPGYPIAEIAPDGSAVITKHPGTGGAVTVETVTAQVLYETATPDYLNPDVVARFDTIELSQEAADRVRISGVRGRPAPDTAKVCVNYAGGFRNSATFVLTGLDIEVKADHTVRALDDALGGLDTFAEADVRLLRTDVPDPSASAAAESRLRVTVKDPDESRVGRRFFDAIGDIGMGGYPGMWVERAERRASAYGVYWPALVPTAELAPEVVFADGRRLPAPVPPVAPYPGYPAASPASSLGHRIVGETVSVPLGRLVGARSGDKGGDANIGLWARSDDAFAWLRDYLDVDRLRLLLVEASDLTVDRYELPRLRALNFVVHGLLGDGVAATTRPDPQAKGLGEYVRSRHVDVPRTLLADLGTPAAADSSRTAVPAR